MSIIRWILTSLAYPAAGWLAYLLVGSVTGPLSGAAAGAVAGVVLGGAQALALERAGGWRWLAATVAGLSLGSAAAAAVTGASTTVPGLAVSGLVTGAILGAAQGASLRRGPRVALLWTITTAVAWALAWVVTANVIVDADRGYVIFGLSGVVVALALGGIVIRRILGRRIPASRGPRAGAPGTRRPDPDRASGTPPAVVPVRGRIDLTATEA